MSQFTSKNFLIAKAPKRIELLGDKTRRPEPAQHIIEFPGGAVEVSRTTDGCYWVHVLITRRDVCSDLLPGRAGAYGDIVGSRITRVDGSPIVDIDNAQAIEQIAVLIKPMRTPGREVGR